MRGDLWLQGNTAQTQHRHSTVPQLILQEGSQSKRVSQQGLLPRVQERLHDTEVTHPTGNQDRIRQRDRHQGRVTEEEREWTLSQNTSVGRGRQKIKQPKICMHWALFCQVYFLVPQSRPHTSSAMTPGTSDLRFLPLHRK